LASFAALIVGAVSGTATYILSKREKGTIDEELLAAQQALELASQHLASVQRLAQTQARKK
jgi:hypothetical protein